MGKQVGLGEQGLGDLVAREWEPLGHDHHLCPLNSNLESCRLGHPGSPSVFLGVVEVGERVVGPEAQLWVDELVVSRV